MKANEASVGDKVGRLTIKSIYSPDGKKGIRHVRALCDCDCGKEVEVSYMKLGYWTNSCGCLRGSACKRDKSLQLLLEDPERNLKGKQFNFLTVVDMAPEEEQTGFGLEFKWICLCKCGTTVNRKVSYLVRDLGNQACDKCSRKLLSTKDPQEGAWRSWYRTYRRSALERGIGFDLGFEEFKNICTRNCVYCNKPPRDYNAYYNRVNFVPEETYNNSWIRVNGIDRLNSDLGYEKGNIEPCCTRCNRMKMILTVEEFLQAVKSIYEHKDLANWTK